MNANRQRGFTFTEVLVAMLVLGISVMAFAGLQVRALQTTGTAHVRSVAMNLAGDLSERIRANPGGLAAYRNTTNYLSVSVPPGGPATWGSNSCIAAGTGANGCAPAQMALFDIREVRFNAAQSLPNGRVNALPCVGATSLTCVYVSWNTTAPTQATCTANPVNDCVIMRVVAQ